MPSDPPEPDDSAERLEADRARALRARAEDHVPLLRALPGPSFGLVLILILAQLLFNLAVRNDTGSASFQVAHFV